MSSPPRYIKMEVNDVSPLNQGDTFIDETKCTIPFLNATDIQSTIPDCISLFC